MVTSKFGYNEVKTTLDADFEGFQLWWRATTAVTKKTPCTCICNDETTAMNPKKSKKMWRFDHP